ncbi:hypothetical protein [Pantoea allii]|uniref:hypothetical protein n=1 Tax=Pantoea allii TaxID=574096 RepID=UPI003D78B3C3
MIERFGSLYNVNLLYDFYSNKNDGFSNLSRAIVMPKIRDNQWRNAFDELFNRLGNAFKSIIFISFFVGGVVLIGGVGIWFPYILATNAGDEHVSFFESINVFTYSFAILGTLCLDIILSNKKSRDLLGLGVLTGMLALALSILGYMGTKTGSSWLVNIGALLTLIIFIFATVNDDKFDSDEKSAEDKSPGTTGYDTAEVAKIIDGGNNE